MDRQRERQTEELANSYLHGKMSRRTFVTRLLALGLAPSVVGAIVAACGTTAASATPAPATAAANSPAPSASSAGAASPSPQDLKGNVRFLVGPWSDGEVDHQKHIAEGFNALHPDVTFDFRLYQWDTAAQEINTSVAEGAHDIYMTTESSLSRLRGGQRLRRSHRADQRPSVRGREGEVPLHGPDTELRPEDPRPADQLARRGRPVRQHGYGQRRGLRRDLRRTAGTPSSTASPR